MIAMLVAMSESAGVAIAFAVTFVLVIAGLFLASLGG